MISFGTLGKRVRGGPSTYPPNQTEYGPVFELQGLPVRALEDSRYGPM